MRKIKLFLAAMAAMVSMGVNAQSWTASEVGVGDFVLYNVGANQYFTSGNDWGTRASITTNGSPASGLTISIEAVGANYKLRTNLNGDGKGVEVLNATEVYNDQSIDKNSTWTIETVTTSNGPAYTIKSAENHQGGSGYYLTANGENTIVMPTTDATTNYSYWKLLAANKVAIVASLDRYATIKAAAKAIASDLDTTNPDAAVAAATTAEGVDAAIAALRAAFLEKLPNLTIPEAGYIDVTDVMVDNASVSQNTDYWTIANLSNPGWNSSAGVCNYGECEFYERNFKFYQTLTLTPGTWEFGVTGFHRAGNHSTYFFAGEDKVLIPGVESSQVNSMADAKTYFDNGNGKVSLKFLIETAGNIEIGIDNKDTETDKWTIFRNFTLKYYGKPDYSVYDNRLAELATEAAKYEGKIPAPAYTTLASIVTEKNKKYTTKADYIAAIEAIEAAIDDATKIQTVYEAFKGDLSVRGKAVKTIALDQLESADAKTNLENVISTADAAIEVCATLDALNTTITTQNALLWTAIGNAINTIELTGDKTLNLTYLLTNPDVTDFPSWKPAPDGWYTDQTGGNFQVMNNDAVNSEDGTKTKFVEYWSWNAKANGEFDLYQKVTLPEGTYKMSCYAVAKDEGHDGESKKGVYFYVDDTQGSLVDNAVLAPKEVEFVNTSNHEVKVGLKSMNPNTYNWVGIGYVELYKIPAQSFTISESAEYDTTQEGAGDVTLTRTIKADVWNTIWLPFSMTADELKATFGEDVAIAEFSETPNANVAGQSTINFNTMSTPAISANKPVLLKTSTAGTSYIIAGRTIVAGTPTTEGTNFDFAGTTVASTTVAAGDYFISSNKLWKSTGATTLAGTRAYLKAKSTGSEARLVIDGEETGVDAINATTVNNGKLYNLNGQEVKNAQKGVFIQNGKKVVLK